jgi:hypothetical protein
METRRDHNHNQREYHPQVDRLPDGVIFSITTPITGEAQRLDLVPLTPGNKLLLDLRQQPACHPLPKRGRAMLIPTVLHDTL